MTPTPHLAPTIRGLLAALRGRIRRYVWLEGLAATVAALGLAFWAGLGVDWFFEPSPAVRKALLAVSAAAAAIAPGRRAPA